MKLVFAGTPAFAAISLEALLRAGHDVSLVLTQPDRPAGRGLKPQQSAVKQLALGHGLSVLQPAALHHPETLAAIAAAQPAALVVVAYGLILPAALLALPPRGCLNVHASLLPRWRGAAPIQRALLAGDSVTGITIMQMDEGLDTGPMLLRQSLDIRGKNAGQVTEEMANLGAELLTKWLANPTAAEPQPVSGATYAKKIDKAEARIDWTQPAVQVERQVRAFSPAPGAWFEANGERIKLLDAVAGADASGKPGEVLDDSLNVACGTGYLRPLKVQRAGRGMMTPGELLRGFPIPKGTILT